DELWKDARDCKPDTPAGFIRLGYGKSLNGVDPDAQQLVDRILVGLKDGPKEEGGNAQFISMVRKVREAAPNNPYLRPRIPLETARDSACDFTWVLNRMEKEQVKLKQGSRCPVEVYDTKVRHEVCLVDTNREDAVWVTSAWDCMLHTGAIGSEQS